MKRRYYSLFCLAALMMLAGCVKEFDSDSRGIPEGALELVAESSNAPGSKALVSGTMVYWSMDEPVRVNQDTLSITTARVEGGQNTAYIAGVTAVENGKHYFVWTPVGLVGGTVSQLESIYGTDGSFIANFPSEYVYEKEHGMQKISGLPMFGVVEAGTSQKVEMKHLSTAVSVDVTNTAQLPILLDSIVLSCKKSGDDAIPLSGLTRYKIRTCAPTYQQASGKKGVKMDFTTSATSTNRRRVAAGAEMKVQVPILPIKPDQNAILTVKVYFHVDWDAAIAADAGVAAWKDASYRSNDALFCKEQSTSTTSAVYTNGIARNKLVHAPMTITMDDAKLKRGLFEIAENTLGAVALNPSNTNGLRLMTQTEMQYLLNNSAIDYPHGSASGFNTDYSELSGLDIQPTLYSGFAESDHMKITQSTRDASLSLIMHCRVTLGRDSDYYTIYMCECYAYAFANGATLYSNVVKANDDVSISNPKYTWSRPAIWGTHTNRLYPIVKNDNNFGVITHVHRIFCKYNTSDLYVYTVTTD